MPRSEVCALRAAVVNAPRVHAVCAVLCAVAVPALCAGPVHAQAEASCQPPTTPHADPQGSGGGSDQLVADVAPEAAQQVHHSGVYVPSCLSVCL